MQAMAEGGHDLPSAIYAEFDPPRFENEATPEFVSLNDLERHLPPILPRYDDPWSVPTEQQQQQQQQQKKPHERGVRAGKKVCVDRERKEYERAQCQEQRRL